MEPVEKTLASERGDETTQSEEAEPPPTVLITDHREILDLMTPILDNAQNVSHAHRTAKSNAILKRMKAARDKCDSKMFPRILFRAYLPIFQSTEKSRFAENLLEFLYVLCVTLDKEEEGHEDKDDAFGRVILRCCTKHHSDERAAVRVNITHLAIKLLDSFSSIDDLHRKFQEKVKDMLMRRVQDKNAQARAYSAVGLKYCQRAENPSHCHVTKALIFHCQYDPNPEVRRAALKSLNMNEETKEYIVERITDANELVRLSAQTNIANKVSMEAVTLDEREKILQVGLTDNSSKVKKRAGLVVDAWLKSCNEDVMVFLSKLDVVTNKKVCCLALNEIFKESTTESFKKVNLSLWGDDKLIPMEKLDEEVAFYWKYVVGKFQKVAYCVEHIFPSTHDICTYLLKYFEVYHDRFAETHGSSVLEQLLEVLLITSVNCEEGGRREILQLVESAFDFQYLDVKHVRVLMELFYKLQVDNVDGAFFELIQNMLATSLKPAVVEQGNAEAESVSNDLTENQILELKLEYGNVIHEKHKAIREKDKALMESDYMKAHNLQKQINELGDREESLRRSISGDETVKSPGKKRPPSTEEEEVVADDEDNPKPSDYFPGALEIAFAAFLEHIQRQPKLSDTAQQFYDTFIITSILNDSEVVRELVIQSMGLIGLSNKVDSKKAMLICLQALIYDQDRIRMAAYRCIFDLILYYGFDHFEDNRIQEVANERGRAVNLNNSLLEEHGPSLKMHVMDQLNSTNQDLVRIGATGLVKLTLAKRLASTKIVIRLLVMWSNPVYDNTQLVRDLTFWLPLFAKMGEEQAFQIADSLVPTMRKLIYAGRQSPLGDASPEKLVSFVANSTTVLVLDKCMKMPASVHERMILSILNEMNNLGLSAEVSIYAKALKFLSVRGLGSKALESLLRKLSRLMQLSLNKNVMPSLRAFHKYMNGELLMVADKQVTANDTASQDEAEGSSDSEESVHISDSGDDEDAPSDTDVPNDTTAVEKSKQK